MSGFVRRQYPPWSWSFSRQQTFTSCQRRYYYNYYGSHNGWEFNAHPEVALAYRLKKLTSIYLVLGDAVHKVAESLVARAVEGREPLAEDLIEEEIRRHLRRVWVASRDERETFIRRPNRVDMLREFYYGLGISESTIAKVNERISRVSKALGRSEIWESLSISGTELISCEQFDTFLLGETPCYAVPDLLYTDETGRFVIVDWKTGEEVDNNRLQMGLYALYVLEKHAAPVEQIVAQLEYLSLGSRTEMVFTAEDLAEVKRYAQDGIKEMQDLLVDPAQNIAKEKEAFVLTEDRDQCYWCNFFELCQSELENQELNRG